MAPTRGHGQIVEGRLFALLSFDVGYEIDLQRDLAAFARQNVGHGARRFPFVRLGGRLWP